MYSSGRVPTSCLLMGFYFVCSFKLIDIHCETHLIHIYGAGWKYSTKFEYKVLFILDEKCNDEWSGFPQFPVKF